MSQYSALAAAALAGAALLAPSHAEASAYKLETCKWVVRFTVMPEGGPEEGSAASYQVSQPFCQSDFDEADALEALSMLGVGYDPADPPSSTTSALGYVTIEENYHGFPYETVITHFDEFFADTGRKTFTVACNWHVMVSEFSGEAAVPVCIPGVLELVSRH